MVDVDIPGLKPVNDEFAFMECTREMELVEERMRWIAKSLGILVKSSRYDRTRRGFHALFWVNRNLSRAVIVCIQALCGSDWKRETFNLTRVLSGRIKDNRWNLLFKEKLPL